MSQRSLQCSQQPANTPYPKKYEIFCTVWPLKMGPLFCPEMPVNTNWRCVTFRKSEDIIYTTAEAWNAAQYAYNSHIPNLLIFLKKLPFFIIWSFNIPPLDFRSKMCYAFIVSSMHVTFPDHFILHSAITEYLAKTTNYAAAHWTNVSTLSTLFSLTYSTRNISSTLFCPNTTKLCLRWSQTIDWTNDIHRAYYSGNIFNKTHQVMIREKNAHKCIKSSYVIHTVYLLHVSATLVVILREVQYKGRIRRDITKLCELTQICKILSFNNT
jgi:hypothetical protein